MSINTKRITNGMISFIVPVYNVQEYLGRCIESILRQTYQNFEIILIDDGSVDHSGEICDQYAKRDCRIRVFHIANGGVGNARNEALTHVGGEWFTFVDADDWIEPEYAMTLYKNAIENDCDISGGGFVFNTGYSVGIDNSEKHFKVLNSSDECIHNFICPGLSLNGMSTLKLYKYEIFGNVRFHTELKINEDCLYVFEVLKKCKRACVTSDKLYHWFLRDDSACHAKPTRLDFSAANVFLKLLQETEYLQDKMVESALKKHYITSASNILFYVRFDKKDCEVAEVMEKLHSWKKEQWSRLNRTEKVKLFFVMYMPWCLPQIRLLSKYK